MAAAAKLFLAAAIRNNAIAQNRVARLLAVGRGLPKNEVEACKWHILARAQGIADPFLDSVLNALSADNKAKVEAAVKRYIGE
jgi:TPR repeat protein